MNRFEKAFELIGEFYRITPSDNSGKEIFDVLKKIIQFESGYISFINSEKSFHEIKQPYLKEDLIYKNTVYGHIIISGGNFSKEDKKIFRYCAPIISNIMKDAEISKIIKMQIKALQDGFLDVRKSNRKIKEAEQVKTKFISHMSHELRTPINSILGFSELLGNEFAGKLNKKQKEYINDIKISSIHLLGMVNEILDMSKIESGTIRMNFREFGIITCVQEVINIINPLLIQKNLTLKQNIEDFQIIADYQKLQQILFNLLSNAIKYTPESGNITVTCKQENNASIISIEDNGIGIEKKNFKRIFKNFEQVGETRENSTGLGLAITKELVKLHKGRINVKSKPDKGTTFSVTIPLR